MNAEDRERQPDKKMDEWLDDALARYSDVEPRAGLEQRILANLQAQPQRRPWWQWAWIPAAAAVLIAAGVLWMTRQRTSPVTPPVQVKHEALPPPRPAPQPATQVVHAVQPPVRSRPVKLRPAVQMANTNDDLPRQEVFPSRDGVGPMFPSPAPLNTQEVALIRLVKRDPEEVRTIAQEQEFERQRLAKMFEESGVPRK